MQFHTHEVERAGQNARPFVNYLRLVIVWKWKKRAKNKESKYFCKLKGPVCKIQRHLKVRNDAARSVNGFLLTSCLSAGMSQ